MLLKSFFKIFVLAFIFALGLVWLAVEVNAQACNCSELGQRSDQGCGIGVGVGNGCPVGTRRECICGGGTGGNCAPYDCNGTSCSWSWSCFCREDAACGSGTTNPQPQPGCTPVAPVAPTSLYTRNPQIVSNAAPGRQLTSNVLRAGWSGGSYGDGCPTVASDDLQIRINDLSAGWVSYGNVNRVDNLEWNTTYRWRVRRCNGNSCVFSGLSFFTTGTPPTISNFSIGTQNLCSASPGFIGSSVNGANNPIVIQFDITDPDNNFAGGVNVLRNARIAFSPINNTYRRFNQLEPTLHQPVSRTSAGFRMNLRQLLSTPVRDVYSTDYSDGSAGSVSTSGTHTNAAGNASLLDINGVQVYSTTASPINNQTVRVKFTVRLENNFANGQFYIFASALSLKSDYNGNEGVFVTPNPAPSLGTEGNTRYENFTVGGPINYQVDLTNPSASVANPQVTGANSFNVNWAASDNVGLAIIRSYCFRNSAPGATIRDTALATNINVATAPISYPSVDNCLVNTAARLGLRSYTDQSGTLTSGLNFRLHVVDNACNSATATNILNASAPWIATGNGNVSANGGFSGFNINETSYNYSNIPNNQLAAPPFLSTYLTISGNNNIVTNRPSARSYIATNYTDNKVSPPARLGDVSWTDTIRNLISQQPGYSSSSLSGLTINAPMSNWLGVPANSYTYRYYTQTLNVTAAATCNVKVVFVIEGLITIDPNFINSGTNNGCVFVSRTGIQISAGTHASAGGTQQYDRIEGLFITDGTFYDLPQAAASNLDKPNASLPADGLYIRGGVIAENVSLRRDLEPTANASFPANIIEYDPTYLVVFGGVLSDKEFSLRQE